METIDGIALLTTSGTVRSFSLAFPLPICISPAAFSASEAADSAGSALSEDADSAVDKALSVFEALSVPASDAAASSDEKVISVTSDDFAADSSADGKTGVGGVQTIVLTAAGEGSAQVTFAYTRSWESGNNAAEIQADVTVDADKKVTFTSTGPLSP